MQTIPKIFLNGIRIIVGLAIAVEGSVVIFAFAPAVYDPFDAAMLWLNPSDPMYHILNVAPGFVFILAFAGLTWLVVRTMPTVPTIPFGWIWRKILRKQSGYQVKGWPAPAAGMDA